MAAAAIILGGIAIAVRMPPPLSRIGMAWTALWVVLLLVWTAASLGLAGPFPYAPLYFYLMMYPFWAFFSLFAGQTLIEAIKARLAPRMRPLDPRWVPPVLCAVAIALLPLFHASPRYVLDWRSPLRRVHTPITEILQREISLRPGQNYRGSVATLFGAPGSPLRRQLLENPEQPLRSSDFESFLRAVTITTGSTHDLLDLWWFDIPTLSEYGQGRSRELMFYVTHILNAISDPPDLNFAFPRLANVNVLRAMGVRFVVTDLGLPPDQAVVRHTLPLKGDVNLYLYELPNPNVTGFSPLRISRQITPSELLQRIRSDPRTLESEAFADVPASENLVAAEQAQIMFERGGIHVTAKSTGRSALLLPIQFSHCFRLMGEAENGARVLRANLLHTLVTFNERLDVRLRWEFSFWRNSGCRLRDAEDARLLGL